MLACPGLHRFLLKSTATPPPLPFLFLFKSLFASAERWQGDAEVGDMLRQPRLSEPHHTAFPKLQICPRQHFTFVRLVNEKSPVPCYDGMPPLQVIDDLESQCGNNLASGNLDQLLPFVNNCRCYGYVSSQVVKEKKKRKRKKILEDFAKN